MSESTEALAMVREATLEDVPEVLAVINRAYVVEAPFIKGDRATAADIRAAVAALKIDLDANHAHIGPIAVEPSRQGSGVGKALVKEAEKYARARGIARMDLCVMSFRQTLPRFYESLGFETIGTAPYDDCCRRLLTDAHRILMSKAL